MKLGEVRLNANACYAGFAGNVKPVVFVDERVLRSIFDIPYDVTAITMSFHNNPSTNRAAIKAVDGCWWFDTNGEWILAGSGLRSALGHISGGRKKLYVQIEY